MLLLFGNIDICEHLFSRMNHMKSKIRWKISHKNLRNWLRIITIPIEPVFEASFTKSSSYTPLVLFLCCPILNVIIKKEGKIYYMYINYII